MRLRLPRAARFGALPLALLALLNLSGCGSPTGSVSGKVLLKDKPVKGGVVTFINPEGGASGSCEIAEDGSYSIPKIGTGNVKICVDTESFNPAKRARTPTYAPPPGAQAPGGYNPFGGPKPDELARRYVKIKAAYAKPETTDLAYVVKPGSQTYDIPLD
jgi:hypothetical protein